MELNTWQILKSIKIFKLAINKTKLLQLNWKKKRAIYFYTYKNLCFIYMCLDVLFFVVFSCL